MGLHTFLLWISVAVVILGRGQLQSNTAGNTTNGGAPNKRQSPNCWAQYHRSRVSKSEEDITMAIKFQIAMTTYLVGKADSVTKCTDMNQWGLDFRWRKCTTDENKFLFSYNCRTNGKSSYEHAEVAGGTLKVYSNSLSHWNYTGAGNTYEPANSEKVDDTIEKFFQFVNGSGHVPSFCKYPGTNTEPDLETKVENQMTYYKFPISCTLGAKSSDAATDDMKLIVEVAIDDINYSVNDGKMVWVGDEGLYTNVQYHKN